MIRQGLLSYSMTSYMIPLNGITNM